MGHSIPARERDGEGEVIPGLMHLSMIAVEPSAWGRGFESIQLWTQDSNSRARRLYAGEGFVAAGREQVHGGERIRLYALRLATK